jgi:pimeloyl-ACP methyl ester carboxylesterase
VTLTAGDQLEHLREAVAIAGMEGVEITLPTEHHAVLGGMRLHFLDWGTAGSPPVLFLHGGGLTARTWDLVCLALRPRAQCFALDQRGHGDSEWSPGMDYDPEAHVGDLEALIARLRLDRPVLVGQSMGAVHSLYYAARHADEVAGLVLVDMTPDVQAKAAERIFDFVTAPAELDSVEEFVKRAMEFNPRRDPRLLRRSLLHNLRRLPDGRWTWKYDRRRMTRERLEAFRERIADLWELLDAVTCPTLVVRGERSEAVTPISAKGLAEALPDGQWATVADAGHTVQGDNPRGLAEVLEPFLRRVQQQA